MSAVGVVRFVSVGPTDWWALVGFCHCGCGAIARSVAGANLKNVLWQWKAGRIVARAVERFERSTADEGIGDPGKAPVARGRRATKAGST